MGHQKEKNGEGRTGTKCEDLKRNDASLLLKPIDRLRRGG